jgi:hypothetical protein
MLMGTIEAFIGRKEDTAIEAIDNIRVAVYSVGVFFVEILDSEAE